MSEWDIEMWRTVAVAAMAGGQTLFAALYLTFPWWETFLGRSLFVKAFVFALMLDVLLIARIWDWEHELEMLLTLYVLLAAALWGQLFAYVRVRMESQKSREAKFTGRGSDD